jgi:hypothetical protein
VVGAVVAAVMIEPKPPASQVEELREPEHEAVPAEAAA